VFHHIKRVNATAAIHEGAAANKYTHKAMSRENNDQVKKYNPTGNIIIMMT
jgi:hypothetical protein